MQALTLTISKIIGNTLITIFVPDLETGGIFDSKKLTDHEGT